MLGILDLRLMGYCKIKNGFLQQKLVNILDLNLQIYYVISLISFKYLGQEKEETGNKSPWLDEDVERRNMAGITYKCIYN